MLVCRVHRTRRGLAAHRIISQDQAGPRSRCHISQSAHSQRFLQPSPVAIAPEQSSRLHRARTCCLAGFDYRLSSALLHSYRGLQVQVGLRLCPRFVATQDAEDGVVLGLFKRGTQDCFETRAVPSEARTSDSLCFELQYDAAWASCFLPFASRCRRHRFAGKPWNTSASRPRPTCQKLS